jgi:lipoate-protein ligase A
VPALDIIAAPALDAWTLLGLELNLLDAQSTGAGPTLLLYTTAGRPVSIGRYHLYKGAEVAGGVGVQRRLTGGRVVGAGDGWLGLALLLPSRDALLRDERAPLRPEQVMNRYVRGLLAGLRALGADCFYPGRDAVTLNGREIAMCTFEVAPTGAMLFEVSLAVTRGMNDLVSDMEQIDPDGLINCPMYGPEQATTLGRGLGHDLNFEVLKDAVAAGDETTLGESRRRELDGALLADARNRGEALKTSRWLNRVAPDPQMTAKNRIATQLGAAEISIARAADGTVDRAMLTGDFIANSAAIERLECELRGRTLDLASVGRVVTDVFGSGDNFILGVGDLSNLSRLIAGVR